MSCQEHRLAKKRTLADEENSFFQILESFGSCVLCNSGGSDCERAGTDYEKDRGSIYKDPAGQQHPDRVEDGEGLGGALAGLRTAAGPRAGPRISGPVADGSFVVASSAAHNPHNGPDSVSDQFGSSALHDESLSKGSFGRATVVGHGAA